LTETHTVEEDPGLPASLAQLIGCILIVLSAATDVQARGRWVVVCACVALLVCTRLAQSNDFGTQGTVEDLIGEAVAQVRLKLDQRA